MVEELKKASIPSFLSSIWNDWGTRMSGIWSVPFATAAVFAPPQYGKVIWIILALIAILFTYYKIWAVERNRCVELQEAIKPKLKLSFNKNDPKCCPSCKTYTSSLYSNPYVAPYCTTEGTSVVEHETTSSNITQIIRLEENDTRYFRIAVEANCVGQINNCLGFLTLIKKDNDVIMGTENLKLTFAPATTSDSQAKTIRNKVPEYLDILGITEENEINIATKDYALPSSIKKDKLFTEQGTYFLEIIVTGDNTVSSTICLKFDWTGDWKTADISCC